MNAPTDVGGYIEREGIMSETGLVNSQVELPPGISREEFDAFVARHNAAEAAAAVPLPGPLLEAFADTPKEFYGFKLRPVVLGDMILLQQLKSPLFELLRVWRDLRELPDADRAKAMAEAEGKMDQAAMQEGLIVTLWVWTKPVAEVRRLARTQGREAIVELALATVADRLPAMAMAELPSAVAAHFASGSATAVEYRAKDPEGDKTFTPPPAPPVTG